MSAWPAISADLRWAMLRNGQGACRIDAMLSALAPVLAAVERAGARVDSDVAWALLAVEADRRPRAQRAQRAGVS